MDTIQRISMPLLAKPRPSGGPSASGAEARHELEGSQCAGLTRCVAAGKLPLDNILDRFSVTVVLNRPDGSGDVSTSATPDQVQCVRDFAKHFGLSVDKISPECRTVRLGGNAEQYEKAFGVRLACWNDADGKPFRAYAGKISLPTDMAQNTVAVLGLSNRRLANPHKTEFRQGPLDTSFNPTDLAKLYNFPKNTSGKGQNVAILEFGGGYAKEEVNGYFKGLGVTPPSITDVSVDGGKNAPDGNPEGNDGEVAMDVEIIGAVAPGANMRVYFAPNTDEGFLDALNAAVHDPKGAANVVSISWGAPENQWSPQAIHSFDNALKDAAAAGINVFVAAGDNGSSDGVTDGANHADFPASSPSAIAIGGTHVTAKGNAIASEPVWNDHHGNAGGGGYSDVFAEPDYQVAHNVPVPGGISGGRGLPDMSANADPNCGYNITVDGVNGTIGGTSAAAPLLAGLAARLGEGLGAPLGFLNSQIYGDKFKDSFRDITLGGIGAFQAAPGWDAASGLGVPDGEKLLAALKAAQPAPPAPPAPAPPPPAPPGGASMTTA